MTTGYVKLSPVAASLMRNARRQEMKDLTSPYPHAFASIRGKLEKIEKLPNLRDVRATIDVDGASCTLLVVGKAGILVKNSHPGDWLDFPSVILERVTTEWTARYVLNLSAYASGRFEKGLTRNARELAEDLAAASIEKGEAKSEEENRDPDEW